MRARYARCCALLLAACLIGCAPKRETAVSLRPLETEIPADVAFRDSVGDYYGWWHIDHTEGDWAAHYGDWWDCCAVLDADGSLLVWDEDFSRSEGLARFHLDRRDGQSVCLSGTMLDTPLPPESVTIGETADENGGRLVTIRGRYTGESGAFSFEILLRPWGSLWPENDERPYYYLDWYLPLIESGSAMPDTIGHWE